MMHLLIPPVLWLILLVAMAVLGETAPVATVFGTPARLLGWAIIVAGLALQAVAAGQFVKARTNLHAFRDPDKLITTGVFAMSRNPMYLGFVLTLVGAALLLNTVFTLIGPLVFFAVANFWYIPREERIADDLFGEPYRAYRARVRRWL
ncbi:isoprenylcysteine carboxylmethyltransferase family protein [Stappia sp. ES.058]|uniref:methyltransferase family protein n=1 Tax=Stappia sp. ES.058 TaxID=1881061 RepID=UPI00087CA800|nr:methyltransferase [Stappia sp. ES.058]SDU02820.1 Protein-S-isoprenylcysteine O-methyltransferase Ste14 [Stappia sp. ES.058]